MADMSDDSTSPRYRALHADASAVTPLDPTYSSLGAARARCESELHDGHSQLDGRGSHLTVTWASESRRGTTIHRMLVHIGGSSERVPIGYEVVEVGSALDPLRD